MRPGGGEIAAYRQFQHLRAEGEDAWFVGATVGGDASRLMGAAQRLVFFDERDICLRGEGMPGYVMEQQDPGFEDEVLRLLDRIDADLYHFHHMWNIGAGTIRRLRALKPQAKFVFTLHELIAICANHGQMVKTSGELCYAAGAVECSACMTEHGPLNFLLREARMKELLGLMDVLISPSRFLRDRFEAWGIAPGRIAVIENGLEAERGPALDAATAARLSRRFAFFGNATPTKGLDVLVRAAALLEADEDAAPLRIEVHGVTAERFAALWPDLPLPANVDFKGRYRAADAVAIMRRQGWVLVPSVWWENSPVVIEEAKAARRPVIASDIGGMLEKTAGWGLQFRVGDPDDLAEVLAAVAGDAERLARIAGEVPAHMTVEAFIAQWRQACGLAAPAIEAEPVRSLQRKRRVKA
nr:glycosyltransferase [Paracoccus sp. S-4012]